MKEKLRSSISWENLWDGKGKKNSGNSRKRKQSEAQTKVRKKRQRETFLLHWMLWLFELNPEGKEKAYLFYSLTKSLSSVFLAFIVRLSISTSFRSLYLLFCIFFRILLSQDSLSCSCPPLLPLPLIFWCLVFRLFKNETIASVRGSLFLRFCLLSIPFPGLPSLLTLVSCGIIIRFH